MSTFLDAFDGAAAPCLLCPGGEAITLPLKEIAIPGFEFFVNNCQTLSEIVPQLLFQNSSQCDLVQSIGTLCGCPKQENACDMCGDVGGGIAAYGWRELDFLADSFGGIVPTCEIIEAGLHTYNDTDAYCYGSQLLLGGFCGCGEEPEPLEQEYDQLCSLCSNGEPVPFPNKTIDLAGFPFPTCGELSAAMETLLTDNGAISTAATIVGNTCFLFRQFDVHCGCQPQYENPCPFCKVDNSYEAPFPDRKVDTALTRNLMPNFEFTCGMMADITMTWDSTMKDHEFVCAGFQGVGVAACGCPPPKTSACEVCPHAIPADAPCG